MYTMYCTCSQSTCVDSSALGDCLTAWPEGCSWPWELAGFLDSFMFHRAEPSHAHILYTYKMWHMEKRVRMYVIQCCDFKQMACSCTCDLSNSVYIKA